MAQNAAAARNKAMITFLLSTINVATLTINPVFSLFFMSASFHKETEFIIPSFYGNFKLLNRIFWVIN